MTLDMKFGRGLHNDDCGRGDKNHDFHLTTCCNMQGFIYRSSVWGGRGNCITIMAVQKGKVRERDQQKEHACRSKY